MQAETPLTPAPVVALNTVPQLPQINSPFTKVKDLEPQGTQRFARTLYLPSSRYAMKGMLLTTKLPLPRATSAIDKVTVLPETVGLKATGR
jgi:hypothetical protein